MRVPQGEFELARYPARADETLRAWDAADEFLLRHLTSGSGESANARTEVLVVNDHWGALATALAACHPKPKMLSDSYLAHAATRHNLARNAIDVSAVQLLASFDPMPASIDVVVLRIPKSLALLEDQLHRIAPHLHAKTVFIAGAMAKQETGAAIEARGGKNARVARHDILTDGVSRWPRIRWAFKSPIGFAEDEPGLLVGKR